MSQAKPIEDAQLFRKIAVATDFAPSASHAVVAASELAAKFGAELAIIHVVEPSPLGPDPAIVKDAGQRALDAAVIRVRDDIPGAGGVLLAGHPAEEVISFAERSATDLVVVGTRGQGALERWVLGSVAAKVVRACRCVLAVHDALRAPRRILVATDFGASSTRAVELAARLATAYAARLTLLHVVEDTPPSYAVDALYAGSLTRSFDDLERAAQTALEDVAQTMSGAVGDRSVLVRRGKAWSEIAAEAEKGQHDLVVLGTHGRAGLSRWLLGSVAEKVLRSALPPVLTVREPTR